MRPQSWDQRFLCDKPWRGPTRKGEMKILDFACLACLKGIEIAGYPEEPYSDAVKTQIQDYATSWMTASPVYEEFMREKQAHSKKESQDQDLGDLD